MSRPLTNRQLKFIEVYLLTDNATEAYKQAYSCENMKIESIYVNANKVLNNTKVALKISEAKQKAKDKIDKKYEITAERIASEFAKIAFSSISHLHNTWIERKDFERIKQDNPDILDCIQEISTKTQRVILQKGESPIEIEYVRLKLYDKQKALENLGKYTGNFYEKDNSQKKEDNIIIMPENKRD